VTPRLRRLCVWLPLGTLGVYLVGLLAVPKPAGLLWTLVFSERSLIELGTAACFLWAAGVGFALWRRTGETALPGAPRWVRGWYLLFALAALFVALEEVSYGQHLFGWSCPRWFSARSAKAVPEINFHNLYGHKPAHRLNALATLVFPLCFVVLPLRQLRGRRDYPSASWAWFVLPRRELFLLVALAQAATWFDDIATLAGSDNYWARATELKELYWSWAALAYALILRTRLIVPRLRARSEHAPIRCLALDSGA
jgi:hypothetical protein